MAVPALALAFVDRFLLEWSVALVEGLIGPLTPARLLLSFGGLRNYTGASA